MTCERQECANIFPPCPPDPVAIFANMTNTIFTGNDLAVFSQDKCAVGEKVDEDLPCELKNYFRCCVPCPSEKLEVPLYEFILKVFFATSTIIAGIIGNALVVAVVLLSKQLRTVTNIFLVNLAISDLLVCSLCVWVHTSNQLSNDYPFSSGLCLISTFLQVWAVTASVFFLVVIAGDRFIAIIFPMHPRITPQIAIVTVVVVWVVSAGAAAPHLFVWELRYLEWLDRTEWWCEEAWPSYYFLTDSGDCSRHSPERRWYIGSHTVILYFFPVVAMVIMYTAIGRRLWYRKLPGEQSLNTIKMQQRSKRKVVRMLIVVLVSFVICWTPHMVLSFYEALRKYDQTLAQWVKDLKYAMLALAYFNSTLNPILYAGLNSNFRQGFHDVLVCSFCKKNRVQPLPAWETSASRNTTLQSHLNVHRRV